MPALEHRRSPRSGSTARSEELLREQQDGLHRRTDRLFANLMVLQWAAGIAAALWISPRTWIGAHSETHLHVWAAILLGGTITSLPVLLARLRPGWVGTRHTVAVAQMLTSALLIHLTGGRVETHFHVFGSLAFLAIYRDWRVLVTATVVTAADHFARGIFWPQSVFGLLAASPWRWLEHAGWVLFEDAFLFVSIRQSLREMREVAGRRAALEGVNAGIEIKIAERTSELMEEIAERKRTAAELEKVHGELLEASRKAGMAEVATAVLHNVGNVLNSVNVAALCVAGSLRKSKAASLARVVGLLREHESDLGTFFGSDARGRQLPGFLAGIVDHQASQQAVALKELGHLQKNIEHIKEIVALQQGYAKAPGVSETVKIADLIEDTLRMNAESFANHAIRVVQDLAEVRPMKLEKHKVLQILVNLVRNAKQACEAGGQPEKTMTLRVCNGAGTVKIAVSDNGIGIPPENLTRIFNHGFTTKHDGHGFGLHGSALAARELGGALHAASAGPGQGATFTLELPSDAAEPGSKENHRPGAPGFPMHA